LENWKFGFYELSKVIFVLLASSYFTGFLFGFIATIFGDFYKALMITIFVGTVGFTSIIFGSFIVFLAFYFLYLISGLYSKEFSLTKIDKFTKLENAYQRLFGGVYFYLIIFFSQELIIFIPIVMFLLISNSYSNLIPYIIGTIVFVTFPFLYFFHISLIQHMFLRFCLWFEGSTPIKYATFLNLAAEARILEKDGGHWRFRHQTLQEHFAKQYDTL
jgi:hypothetical protein